MHPTARHGARDRVPYAGLDARRLVRDDQDVLAMIALEIRSPIGRETQGEVAVVTQPELGILEFRVMNLRLRDEAMNL